MGTPERPGSQTKADSDLGRPLLTRSALGISAPRPRAPQPFRKVRTEYFPPSHGPCRGRGPARPERRGFPRLQPAMPRLRAWGGSVRGRRATPRRLRARGAPGEGQLGMGRCRGPGPCPSPFGSRIPSSRPQPGPRASSSAGPAPAARSRSCQLSVGGPGAGRPAQPSRGSHWPEQVSPGDRLSTAGGGPQSA